MIGNDPFGVSKYNENNTTGMIWDNLAALLVKVGYIETVLIVAQCGDGRNIGMDMNNLDGLDGLIGVVGQKIDLDYDGSNSELEVFKVYCDVVNEINHPTRWPSSCV